MKWSDLPLRPNDRTLRQFAAIWIVFFGGLAAYQGLLADRPGWGIALAAASLIVGPIGLLWPQAIKPVFVVWIVAAVPIGWTISLVLLGALFYLIFTPLGLFFRLIGRDPLGRTPKPNFDTYWTTKPAMAPAQYFRTY